MDVVGLAAVVILGAVLAAGLTNSSKEFLGMRFDISTQADLLLVLIAMAGFFILKSAISTALLKVLTSFLASIEVRIATEITEFLISGNPTRMRLFDRSYGGNCADGVSKARVPSIKDKGIEHN